MRKINKYKIFYNPQNLSNRFSERVFNFQRPKWNFFKKSFKKVWKNRFIIPVKKKNFLRDKKLSTFFLSQQLHKKRFLNCFFKSFLCHFFQKLVNKKKSKVKTYKKKRNEKRYLSRKRRSVIRGFASGPLAHLREFRTCRQFDRVKQSYNKGHQTQLFLRNIYNNSVSVNFFRKELFHSKFRRDTFINVLVKPLYKFDILLWNLFLFRSTFSARQAIIFGNVLLNQKVSSFNCFLKKGDVITFASNLSHENLFSNFQKYTLNHIFFTFLEIDYYTKTIVILKNFDELSLNDFYFLVVDSIRIKNLHAIF